MKMCSSAGCSVLLSAVLGGPCHSKDEHDSHSGNEQEAEHSHSHDAAAAQESVVIDVPAAAMGGAGSSSGAPCGLNGHAMSCRCTISKTGSREIEVRCELPVSAALPGEAAAAAASSSRRRRSLSHGGHSHSGDEDPGSLNLRSAVLHVIGDLLQSVGVAIAGALIWYNQDDPRWYLADPICTFIFSIVVLLTTRSILRDIVHVLMERTPTDMDVPAVARVRAGDTGGWAAATLQHMHDTNSMPVRTCCSRS